MMPDIQTLHDQLAAAELEARALASGLTVEQGTLRPSPTSWSIAECLDHLATTNRVYLVPMNEAAMRGRVEGKLRRGPALPGIVGRWFVSTLEPPVKPGFRMKSPRVVRPQSAPGLSQALADFLASQEEIRLFLHTFADLDLAGIRFVNPLIRGVRFSVATGLNNILAHERRHLWQARQVRQSIASN